MWPKNGVSESKLKSSTNFLKKRSLVIFVANLTQSNFVKIYSLWWKTAIKKQCKKTARFSVFIFSSSTQQPFDHCEKCCGWYEWTWLLPFEWKPLKPKEESRRTIEGALDDDEHSRLTKKPPWLTAKTMWQRKCQLDSWQGHSMTSWVLH